MLNHFNYDVEIVLPYIKNLSKNTYEKGFHIEQYEENHSNIDDKLSDLKNILIKYFPNNNSTDIQIDVLTEIFQFEEDLIKHTRIEDKILIPYVHKKEEEYITDCTE